MKSSVQRLLCSPKNLEVVEPSLELPAGAIGFLHKLGNAGVSFFRALERLYLKSAKEIEFSK